MVGDLSISSYLLWVLKVDLFIAFKGDLLLWKLLAWVITRLTLREQIAYWSIHLLTVARMCCPSALMISSLDILTVPARYLDPISVIRLMVSSSDGCCELVWMTVYWLKIYLWSWFSSTSLVSRIPLCSIFILHGNRIFILTASISRLNS